MTTFLLCSTISNSTNTRQDTASRWVTISVPWVSGTTLWSCWLWTQPGSPVMPCTRRTSTSPRPSSTCQWTCWQLSWPRNARSKSMTSTTGHACTTGPACRTLPMSSMPGRPMTSRVTWAFHHIVEHSKSLKPRVVPWYCSGHLENLSRPVHPLFSFFFLVCLQGRPWMDSWLWMGSGRICSSRQSPEGPGDSKRGALTTWH